MPALEELRQRFRSWLMPGAGAHTCPVCTQRVQLYKRKLHAGMAFALVRLYNYDDAHSGKFMDYRDYRARGESRNHPYLRFWGLIEGGDQGWWRITPHGRAFVEERCLVPWAIWHFNDRCYGFTKKRVSIRMALGDRFDLDQLLASRAEKEAV
jgi:hypothetical protein